jgi:hypothetical protein
MPRCLRRLAFAVMPLILAAAPLTAVTASAQATSSTVPNDELVPADPLASPATASLLNWLAQLPTGGIPGAGTVASGYFAGYSADPDETPPYIRWGR